MIGLKLKLIMNKWIVRYNDKDGDSCSVWTKANSKDEALKKSFKRILGYVRNY